MLTKNSHKMTATNKNIYYKTTRVSPKFRILATLFIMMFLASCDLELQTPFKFDSSIETPETFGDKTALQWMKDEKEASGEYAYILEAIELTGMEEEYLSSTIRKTLFLIRDEGFTANKGILRREFGIPKDDVDTYDLEQFRNLISDDLNKNKLKNILRYHIINTYVDQSKDEIEFADTAYTFTTTSGDKSNNTIEISKSWELDMSLNFYKNPDTAYKQGIKQHNYVFSNGSTVAHIIDGYARNDLFGYGETTPFQWLTINPNSNAYTLMLQAIELTGLKEIYDDVNATNTYFLLNDEAFTHEDKANSGKNEGGIIRLYLRSSLAVDATNFDGIDTVDTNTLKNILLSCILDSYIDTNIIDANLNTNSDPFASFNTLFTTISGVTQFMKTYGENEAENKDRWLTFSQSGAKGFRENTLSKDGYPLTNGNSIVYLLDTYPNNDLFRP